MNRNRATGVIMLRYCVALLVLAVPVGAADEEQFRELFNGKDLDGWRVEGAREYQEDGEAKPVWVVKDGMLTCMVNSQASFGFLRYKEKEFGDFVLHVEYRMIARPNPKAARCNSGIGIRTVPFDPLKIDSRPSVAAYEVQLLDDGDRKPDKHSTGSLYGYVAPEVSAAKPGGEWNALDIECAGPRIRISLNEKKVLDVDQTTVAAIKDKPLKGYICLQNHGGKIDFRNIKIREIKARQ
jgi:Domain of Unknown Function (DUF1080)